MVVRKLEKFEPVTMSPLFAPNPKVESVVAMLSWPAARLQ